MYSKQPLFQSYIIQGQGRYYRAGTQPPGRAAAACVPPTHSAEQRSKRKRARETVVTMNTASMVKGFLRQPFVDKSAWLQSVCGKPADGEDFICCCGANFGDGSGMEEGQAIEHECSAQHREGVERHKGCSMILEGIVYLAVEAAAASTGKKNSGLSYRSICKSVQHRTVCVLSPPPQKLASTALEEA